MRFTSEMESNVLIKDKSLERKLIFVTEWPEIGEYLSAPVYLGAYMTVV